MHRGAARITGAALFAVIVGFLPTPGWANPCADAAPSDLTGRAVCATQTVVFRAVPAPIAVGRHFALDAIACPRRDDRVVTSLRVDAVMPEHRHGMNYRASVSPRGDGRFFAEGLLFHMPGRWQLVFDVETSAGTERLTAEMVLE